MKSAATTRSLLGALAVSVIAPLWPATAAGGDDTKREAWFSLSVRGQRIGSVHLVYRKMLDDEGEVVSRRVDRFERFTLTDPAGNASEVARSTEAVFEPDWTLRSYTTLGENPRFKLQETASVVDGQVRAKRVEWVRKQDGSLGEAAEAFDRTFALDGGGMAIAHPFQLGEMALGVDLRRSLKYVDSVRSQSHEAHYRVTDRHEDGSFSVACRDGPRSFEYVLDGDGMPLRQTSVEGDMLLVRVAGEAEAKDLSAPAPEADYARGLGVRMKDGVHYDYPSGFSLRWPGLPWVMERRGKASVLLGDPARECSIRATVIRMRPDQTLPLDEVVKRVEPSWRKNAESYETDGEARDVKLGELAAKEVTGRLRSLGREVRFRNVYIGATPERAYVIVAHYPPEASEAFVEEIERVMSGFAPLPPEALEVRTEDGGWRDPQSAYEVQGPKDGWTLERGLMRPGKQNPPGAEVWLKRADGGDRMWVMSIEPPLGTSLQEMADDSRKHAGQEFGSQVSDVTTEIGELGGRKALRVRFLASEDGGGASPFVVRRIMFIEGGRLLILNGLITDPANEEELVPVLEEAAKTLRFWEP